MARLTLRTPRLRHLRRALRIPFGRRRRSQVWFDQQSTDLDGTGTDQTFTAEPGAKATGVLTLTTTISDGEDVTINGKVYTFLDTLVNADGNVQRDATAATSLENLRQAINLTARQVAATGVLTLTGNAGDTETVTVGGKTYTFQTTLDNLPNNVLIGASASDSIDNLIAAINLAAGVGTLYGQGTAKNPDASAAAGGGDSMDLTAAALGPDGNSVVTTETMTNGSFGGGTLTGGRDRWAALMTKNQDVSAVSDATTVTLTALVDGLAGNSITTTENMANASFGAGTLLGGLDPDILTISSHGHDSGDGPFVVSTTGTLPAGLEVDVGYWPGVIDANTLKLYPTQTQALVASGAIDFTDSGSGTHTMTPSTSAVDLVEKVRQQDVSTERLNTLTDIDDIT